MNTNWNNIGYDKKMLFRLYIKTSVTDTNVAVFSNFIGNERYNSTVQNNEVKAKIKRKNVTPKHYFILYKSK